MTGQDDTKQASTSGEIQGGDATQNESWREKFPQAAQQGTVREDYQRTADERRVQAEAAAKRELQRRALVDGEPVPSGEGENVHADEPDADPEGDGR